MEASDAVVPFKKEKNLETVNAFLIRSYQKPYNPNAVSTQIKAYEKLSDEVAGLLNEGCEEQTTVQGQPHPDTQVFRMRPGRLVMYNSTRSSLENDLSVTDLEPRGRFYTTVLAKEEKRPLILDKAVEKFKKGVVSKEGQALHKSQ